MKEQAEGGTMLAKRSLIVIRTSFTAFHKWPECPYPAQKFLKSLHRHKFYVEVRFEVTADRQVEFFHALEDLESITKEYKGKDLDSSSCETICDVLQYRLFQKGYTNVVQVGVFEDNENGAIHEYDPM